MQYDIVDGGYLTWIYGSKPFSRGNWPPQSVRGAILALDCLDDTFRKRRDETYKANRIERRFDNPDAYAQWHRIRELRRDVVEDPRLHCVRISGLEADDIIALAAWKFATKKSMLLLLAQDKDLLQIQGVNITDNQGVVVDLARFSNRLPKAITREPLTREQIPLVLALMGDKSDNVPRLVDRGDLWRMSQILRLPKVSSRYALAKKFYGEPFLRNLYAVVLPDPHIFGFTRYDVFELLADEHWGAGLLSSLKTNYKFAVKKWSIPHLSDQMAHGKMA